MTTPMNGYRMLAVLFTAMAFAACEKNAVQVLPDDPPLSARIKFFNFGVSAPSVNFYADATKMTAIQSGTESEATTGVAYGAVGNGGAYSQLAPGSHALTGRIAAATDKDLPIATVNATIADGKTYSFYMSGIYNTTTKTSDGFVVEDPIPATIDYATAYVRFVNAISNASPLTLYATIRNAVDTTKIDTVSVNAAVAYKSAGAFTTLTGGIYNLFARYTDSTTNKVSRTNVSFLGGRVYTIGARGDITVATGTNAPALDNTANR